MLWKDSSMVSRGEEEELWVNVGGGWGKGK